MDADPQVSESSPGICYDFLTFNQKFIEFSPRKYTESLPLFEGILGRFFSYNFPYSIYRSENSGFESQHEQYFLNVLHQKNTKVHYSFKHQYQLRSSSIMVHTSPTDSRHPWLVFHGGTLFDDKYETFVFHSSYGASCQKMSSGLQADLRNNNVSEN